MALSDEKKSVKSGYTSISWENIWKNFRFIILFLSIHKSRYFSNWTMNLFMSANLAPKSLHS